jgi:hypothetical protein
MSALRDAAQRALAWIHYHRRTYGIDEPVEELKLRAALAQQEQDQMLEHAYKSACDIVEEQDKKLAELEAVNRELLDALRWIATVNAMDYEYQVKARAAIAKAEGAQK